MDLVQFGGVEMVLFGGGMFIYFIYTETYNTNYHKETLGRKVYKTTRTNVICGKQTLKQ